MFLTLFLDVGCTTLLENITDDANAQPYVTQLSTISLYLTKLFVSPELCSSIISHIKRNPPPPPKVHDRHADCQHSFRKTCPMQWQYAYACLCGSLAKSNIFLRR